ncbi:unnamed protein product [Caenorhabditis brenneri]
MNTIPLHQLPDEASLLVLQSMEIYDQLAYSLCSKNTKKSIKSLNLTAEKIYFCVFDSLEFEFRFKDNLVFWSSMNHDYFFPNEEFIVPKGIKAHTGSTYERSEWELKSQNIGVKEWLHHFCEVLHHPRIDDLYFNGVEIEEDFIKPVQKVIEGLQLVYFGLGEDLTPEFTKKALESFHNYEELHIDRISFNSHDVHEMDRFLVQNLSEVFSWGAERLQMSQLLISNCEKLRLMRSLFTDKDLKVFLKLWIHGSNPRLKYFYTCRRSLPEQPDRPFNEEMFFKGINRTKIPMDSQEVYREKMDASYKTKLAGGSRIWRYDGTPAVVLITLFGFELFVDV